MKEQIPLKILKFFLENPYDEVYLRELAKKLKISPFAVKMYIDFLVKEDLVKEERKANLRYFKANINNLFFKHLKISFNINSLLKSGVIEFIKNNLANVSSIVLFGSMAKGEDDEKSDIDILVIGKEKYLDLGDFEEKIEKKITIHIFSWSEWNKKSRKDSPFYYEVISHGIPFYGDLPLSKWK